MNPPLVLGHAGEEVIYVLVPVALIMWLRNIAKQRAERENEASDGSATREESSEKPD